MGQFQPSARSGWFDETPRVEAIWLELRRLGHRALSVLGEPLSVIDAQGVFVARGLWSLCVVVDPPAIVFQVGAAPVDVIVWDRQGRAFTCWSNPREPIDPLGYLRMRLIEAVEAARRAGLPCGAERR